MLKNKKTVYFCQECGYESAKWMGQCPGCKSWNTFVEETVSTKKPSSSGAMKSSEKRQEPVILKDISLSEDERQTTQIGELDRVLGGGIVPGSLVLVGGDPGIGKSTLLLQVCRNLAEKQVSVLYISGEESLRQIKLRANRIGQFTDKMQLLCETNLEVIREVIERRKPDVVVIDSIQTMFHEDVSSAPGSVSQVRESTNILMQIAKGMGVSIFIVGHVTKEGNVAGPRVLEHMVDTVLYFEGDRHASYRILRAVKNRFGSTNEIGVFEMQKGGLVDVIQRAENAKPGGHSVPPAGFLIFIGCKPEGKLDNEHSDGHAQRKIPRTTGITERHKFPHGFFTRFFHGECPPFSDLSFPGSLPIAKKRQEKLPPLQKSKARITLQSQTLPA